LAKVPKIVIASAIQLVVLIGLALGVYLLSYFLEPPYPAWVLVLVQGLAAAWLTLRLGLPSWWRWIQLFLPIALYAAVQIDYAPIWALIIAIVIIMLFANAFFEQVPLYLTNETTRQALKKLVRSKRDIRFLDLGCGLGGNVTFMSQQKAVTESHGVETAPIPFFVSKLYTIFRGGRTFAMDMWKTELAYYDVVYAFLSPEPMPRLWEKVKEEMQPGSVFISNSFPIPDIEASEIWQLPDSRQTILYIYHL
jgi:hypothetical protein